MRLCSVSSGTGLAARWRICNSILVNEAAELVGEPLNIMATAILRAYLGSAWAAGRRLSPEIHGVAIIPNRPLADSSPVLCLRCDHPELAERVARGRFCLFSYASLAHLCRHSAEQYLAVAMTLRLIDCPQRRHVLASVTSHSIEERGGQRAG
jgi:hypothetical protein